MALAPPEIRDVILRDGSTLRLRPPHASDTDAVLGFFGALSERSVYWRFHGFPALTPSTVEPFLDPDWEESGSLIGALSLAGEGERIALEDARPLTHPEQGDAGSEQGLVRTEPPTEEVDER